MRAKPTQIGLADEIFRPLVVQIFNHWRLILNHPRSLLDAQKFRIIVTQLELGHTPENLMLAIEGVAVDPWEGRKQHDSLDVIFRSENIDRFMTMGDEAKEWSIRQQEKIEKAMALRNEVKPPSPMSPDIRGYLDQFRAKMVTRS